MKVEDVGQMLYIAPDSSCFQHSEQPLLQTSALSLSPLLFLAACVGETRKFPAKLFACFSLNLLQLLEVWFRLSTGHRHSPKI